MGAPKKKRRKDKFTSNTPVHDRAGIWSARWALATVVVAAFTAWILVQGERAEIQVAEFEPVPNPMVANTLTGFKMSIRNVGKGTAYLIGGSTNWKFASRPEDGISATPHYGKEDSPLPSNYRTHILPNEMKRALMFPTGQGAFREFNQEQVDMLYSGRARYWVYGFLTYSDRYSLPFIGNRTTGYCYEFSVIARGFVDCGEDGRNYTYN